MEEKSKTEYPIENFYLICNLIDSGFYPAKLARHLNWSKQRLNSYVARGKELGIILKLGLGAWEINHQKLAEFKEKRVKLNTPLGSRKVGGIGVLPVRGHAFQFTLDLPERVKLGEWVRRVECKSVGWVELPKNKVIRIKFRNNLVWLGQRSITTWFKKSFWGNNAKETHDYALSDFRDWVRGLESFLRVKLFSGERLKFKISRNHFALVQNELAKQFDRENRKLQVWSDSGLWLIIDNSFNLHELESVHPKEALPDNKVIQDFFNGLRENPNLVSDFVSLQLEAKQQFEVISNLSANLTALVKVFEKAVRRE